MDGGLHINLPPVSQCFGLSCPKKCLIGCSKSGHQGDDDHDDDDHDDEEEVDIPKTSTALPDEPRPPAPTNHPDDDNHDDYNDDDDNDDDEPNDPSHTTTGSPTASASESDCEARTMMEATAYCNIITHFTGMGTAPAVSSLRTTCTRTKK